MVSCSSHVWLFASIDGSLPSSSVHGILHARILVKVKVKSLSCVWLFATPWTVAHQDPPSMGFSRQEYWSGLPFPSPGDLPDPGIEPRSPALEADDLTSEPPGPVSSRILEWLAVSTSRRSTQLRDQTCISYISWIGRQSLLPSNTWEAHTTCLDIAKSLYLEQCLTHSMRSINIFGWMNRCTLWLFELTLTSFSSTSTL